MKSRAVRSITASVPVTEGAGVQLRRAVGFHSHQEYDPFLLLDDFRSDNPDEYRRGFPWHPHRGIETITYMLAGAVAHGDSLGNSGTIHPGEVQWMTAGSGIVHQEMPAGDAHGRMYGFQLWANLPAASKMTHPKYRDVRADMIPVYHPFAEVTWRIIAGAIDGVHGPVSDVVIDPFYGDLALEPDTEYAFPVPRGHAAFLYCFEGECVCEEKRFRECDLVLLEDGDIVRLHSGRDGSRMLVIAGKPLGEPVAWRGPIVMNTDAELRTAYRELDEGTFLKHAQ